MSMRFEWNGRTVQKKYDAASFAAINETNEAAADVCRDLTWVDTGAARRSVRAFPAQRSGRKIVGSFGSDGSVDYYHYINSGTRYIRGGFFIERAADQVLPTFPARLARHAA